MVQIINQRAGNRHYQKRKKLIYCGKTLIMWQITVRCCLAMRCHPLSERCPNDLLT